MGQRLRRLVPWRWESGLNGRPFGIRDVGLKQLLPVGNCAAMAWQERRMLPALSPLRLPAWRSQIPSAGPPAQIQSP